MKKITVRAAAKILDVPEKILARLIVMDKLPEVGFAKLNNKKHSYYIFEDDVINYKMRRDANAKTNAEEIAEKIAGAIEKSITNTISEIKDRLNEEENNENKEVNDDGCKETNG